MSIAADNRGENPNFRPAAFSETGMIARLTNRKNAVPKGVFVDLLSRLIAKTPGSSMPSPQAAC
jgi:hypothetical protein